MCGRIKEKAVKQDIRRKSLLLPEENKKPYGREKQSMENVEQQISEDEEFYYFKYNK